MGLLGFLFGALKWLLFGSPTQQQDPPKPYQRQQRQWESRPYRVVSQPPVRLEQPPLNQRRVTGGEQGQNQVENASSSSLRARAIAEGDAMAKSFQGSREARVNGDYALAHELSNKGERHRAEMERLNKKASESIFAENNKDSQPGEVDLHGLYVKEATVFAERFVQEARNRGDTQINLIVGQGRHSLNGAAKIKPAIERLMKEQYNLVAKVHPSNAGVLVVSFDGQARGTGGVVRSRGLRTSQSRRS